ncbi:hypothetical protein J6590_005316 [Homalodisca vitripennis]|nr:hypothetical protein J6590_005316 [Homalodisca vitripennis]
MSVRLGGWRHGVLEGEGVMEQTGTRPPNGFSVDLPNRTHGFIPIYNYGTPNKTNEVGQIEVGSEDGEVDLRLLKTELTFWQGKF